MTPKEREARKEEPIRWRVKMGKGIKELFVYPLTLTREQAEERAMVIYPEWSVLSCEKHKPEVRDWKI